jgi:hypothetical protein
VIGTIVGGGLYFNLYKNDSVWINFLNYYTSKPIEILSNNTIKQIIYSIAEYNLPLFLTKKILYTDNSNPPLVIFFEKLHKDNTIDPVIRETII